MRFTAILFLHILMKTIFPLTGAGSQRNRHIAGRAGVRWRLEERQAGAEDAAPDLLQRGNVRAGVQGQLGSGTLHEAGSRFNPHVPRVLRQIQ